MLWKYQRVKFRDLPSVRFQESQMAQGEFRGVHYRLYKLTPTVPRMLIGYKIVQLKTTGFFGWEEQDPMYFYTRMSR